ncbi:DUF1592 domain-containing protein [Aureliella helgolandensis]|uniref:DUF1592 domain-containing protein n=1 Tax=Aureliella helgolandensis TaxID=2527968 RepID=UPI0018D06B74|nr:DUF1592 domain-containing protein [Aureliella helgolandensis]
MPAADQALRQRELEAKVAPLLSKHCYGCHSGAEADAGLALDHFETISSYLKSRVVWEKVIEKLQLDAMPPPDASELAPAERQFLVTWIRDTINDFECGQQPNPGSVTLRRLNAAEYQNTIQALLGVNYTPAANFPGDDVGYGFDNIGDVLTLPPMLMEKYLVAAEKISRYVIQTPPPDQVFQASYAGAQLEFEGGGNMRDGALSFYASGVASIEEQLPWTGKYRLTITAGGDQVGEEPCQMGIAVGEKRVGTLAVPNDTESPQEFEIELRLGEGARRISIGFLNDFYIAAKGGQPAQDRNLSLFHVELIGRKSGGTAIEPSQLRPQHRRVVFTTPSAEKDSQTATHKVLERLASRAYRRPVATEELRELVGLALEIQAAGDSFEESIQVAMQAILISPHFLFRVESPPASEQYGEYRNLDEFELASRLSYFLWSSMPDDELLGLALQNQLRVGNNLERQVARMLKDERARAFVSNFASQWLMLRKLESFVPDEQMFPKWNDRIKELSKLETLNFFAGVLKADMSVIRLLDADFTFLNQELAEFYGMSGVQGDDFVRVSLAGTPRSGLLTQASVLAVTSNPTRTSPVKRGRWILDNLLATPPPPPPPGVPELQEKGPLVGSMRQQLEQHRADPNCAGCHKLMDPLGFALENFDAIGLYREQEHGVPVDSSGVLPDGTRVSSARELQRVLTEQNRQKFVECVTEKLLTYALGRGLEYYDKCAVDKILATLEDSDFRFSALISAIVHSDPFQKKGEREIAL